MSVDNTQPVQEVNENNSTAVRISRVRISNEKRKDLLRFVYEEGHAIKEAAELLRINYSSARTIIKIYEDQNRVVSLPTGGFRRSIRNDDLDHQIELIISRNPQFTLKEIAIALKETFGENFAISLSTINRSLKDLKITMKQTHRELDRVNLPEKIRARKEYALWFNNYFANEFFNAIFIDESSFNTHLQRSQARSPRGTRANVSIPTVRGRSVTLIASLSINGMCYCKTICNSTVNANIFSAYIQELCVYLRDNLHMERACLILDNARIHRRDDIQRITSQFNFEFQFLAPYSYMLNPIENAFSKIKNGIRSRLRSGVSGILSELILEEVNMVTGMDCAGYFRYILCNITNCAAELPYHHQ